MDPYTIHQIVTTERANREAARSRRHRPAQVSPRSVSVTPSPTSSDVRTSLHRRVAGVRSVLARSLTLPVRHSTR
jgi:hypothetical protein